MSHKKKSIALSVLLVVIVLSGALAFVAGRTRGLAAPTHLIPPRENQVAQDRNAKAGGPGLHTSAAAGTVVVQPNSQRSNVEVIPIILKRGGFAPGQITRSAGSYFLSVSNMSGVPDIQLQLSREEGGIVHESRVPKERPAWRQNVHLTPGTYLLTERTHKQWVCRITITAP